MSSPQDATRPSTVTLRGGYQLKKWHFRFGFALLALAVVLVVAHHTVVTVALGVILLVGAIVTLRLGRVAPQ